MDHQPHQGNADNSLKKTEGEVSDPNSDKPMQPEYAKNETRSIKPEILVAVGICTHLGCSPSDKFKTGPRAASPPTGRAASCAPCHGSTFDMAGRAQKKSVRHLTTSRSRRKYLSDAKILIGEDGKGLKFDDDQISNGRLLNWIDDARFPLACPS